MEPSLDAFADVPYTRSYHRELEPGPLRVLAALAGLAPPPARGFSFCEVGSGAGVTLNALAAANPGARFVGVDVSDEHVAIAERAAREAGLGNVEHLRKDARDLAQLGDERFDFVALHGVYSWVGADVRAAIAAFARDRLAPNGLLFVSYNALPGWTALAPLRARIRDEAVRATGEPLERARRAVLRAAELRDAGDAALGTKAARAMIDVLLVADPRYVVHELLTRDWEAFSSSDVADELARVDLHRVGQLPLWENVLELATPAGALDGLRGLGERDLEAKKDAAVGRLLRRDVFVRGAPRLDAAGSRAFFAETPFGATTRAPASEVSLPHHTLTFSGSVYAPLLDALGRRAAPLIDLARTEPELASLPIASVLEAARNLVIAGVAAPFVERVDGIWELEAAAPDDDGAWTVDLAHDRRALAAVDDPQGATRVTLASRALGAGVTLSKDDARALASLLALRGPVALEGRLADLVKLGVVRRVRASPP